MANYTILHQLVQAVTAATTTVVVFEPPPLLSATLSGQFSQYFNKGDVVTDVQLGGATPVARLVALNAIA